VSKNRTLLLLLAITACCACVAFWQLRGDDPRPPQDVDPSLPSQDAGAAKASAADGSAVDGSPVDGDAQRTAPDGGATAAACELTIDVLVADPDAANGDPSPTGEASSTSDPSSTGKPASERPPQPAPFTELTLRFDDGGPGDVLARPVTDARGRAHLRLENAAGRRVVASAGCGGSAGVQLHPSSPNTLTLVIRPRVIVQGRVIDAAGVGVPGADIVLLRWPEQQGATDELWRVGRSGAGGGFRVALQAGGRIGATHAHFAPSPMFLVRPRRDRSQPVPTQTFDLHLLGAAVAVTGVVQDMNGAPIAGAHVDLRPLAPAPRDAELAAPPRRASSARDGAFRVDGLPQGELRWSARKPGFGWASGTLRATTGAATPLVVELPWSATIDGTVVAADETPIAGARVVAGDGAAGELAQAVTGADGSFRLTDLGAGQVALRASFGRASVRGERALQPGGHATWNAVLAVADDGPRLTGKVVDDDDEPLVGWRVVVRQRGRLPRGDDTDEAGGFAVAVADAAPLDVRVYAPGRAVTAFADALVHDVDAAEGELLVRVPAERSGTVRGLVVDSAYRGVPAGVEIWHQQRREHARFEAGDDGRLHVPGVPVGDIELTFHHSGHCKLRRSAQVRAGDKTELDTVQLAQAGALFGRVTSPGGVAPPHCELVVLTSGERRERLLADYSAGAWRLPDVPPGTHTLLVTSEGMATASFQVTAQAGVEREYDVELSQGLRRVVRVTVPADAGDRVQLVLRLGEAAGGGGESGEEDDERSRPQWFASAKVRRDGKGGVGVAEFETCMAAGDYRLRAWTNGGYESEQLVPYRYDGEPAVELRLQR